MAHVATARSYDELQQKIKDHLAHAVETNRINKEDLLAVLFLLGQPTTLSDLEMFIEIFADSFPVLKTLRMDKRSEVKLNFEDKIKKVVSKLVFTNPKRAGEITKEALKKGASWKELVQKYPELGED